MTLGYLTSELVRKPSVSMEPFLNVQGIRDTSTFIVQWLRENGVDAKVVELEKGWPSVIAGEDKPRILLLGHFDVVPAGDERRWAFPPFSGEIYDGKVFGRGSNDMKGGVAVFMQLMTKYPGIGMFLSPDEEIGSLHSTLIYSKMMSPEIVLVSEPSGSANLVVGEKGMIIARVKGDGVSVHGSLPWRGKNAVDDVLDKVTRIYNFLKENEPEVPTELKEVYHNTCLLFGEYSRKITVNLGVIEGGRVPTMVPDSSFAELDIRLPHGTPKGIVEKLKEWCEIKFVTYPNYYMGKWMDNFESSAIKSGISLMKIIDPADNDGRLFRERGIPSLCYGPGSEFNSHVYNEYVEIKELERVSSVYSTFLDGALHELEI
ncbi:M20 family metallopeptidase [Sulfuracidifex tepidarius]|uniref:Metallohydrolase n=1 Tax=Sulfuracidifex tepidarius TaxID=1294262 RepID=A0A510E5H7_9CREN|nr:M20/M25/M40 family metallo-hydrolase [Sulfuracidifex tepidarius]BBG27782.1 putative metallohydrolase [Sulfuracidifex tepidarius]